MKERKHKRTHERSNKYQFRQMKPGPGQSIFRVRCVCNMHCALGREKKEKHTVKLDDPTRIPRHDHRYSSKFLFARVFVIVVHRFELRFSIILFLIHSMDRGARALARMAPPLLFGFLATKLFAVCVWHTHQRPAELNCWLLFHIFYSWMARTAYQVSATNQKHTNLDKNAHRNRTNKKMGLSLDSVASWSFGRPICSTAE